MNERFLQRITEFEKAIYQLEKALNQEKSEYIRDAVIQRFEFTYELAWKAAKLWLAEKQIDARNPRDVFAESLAQGLIQDGNLWSDLQKMRNQTSHTYDMELAEDVYEFIAEHGLNCFNQLLGALK